MLSREAMPIPEKLSQFGSQSATRLREAGIAVIAEQHAAVNTFPGLVHTARHTMGADKGRSRRANLREAGAQALVDDWGEVVTR